jgi:uncharacterized protein (TIGR02246 family)
MNNNFNSLLVYFLLALMSISCTSKQNEKTDMNQLMTAISENDDAWNALDVNKIVGMFAENGTVLNNNSEMLRGREAIRKSFEIEPKYEKLEFKRDKVEVKMEGNMAYEIVNQIVTFKLKEQESQTILNKYIHIWEKQKDGSWKVLIDMNNLRKSSGE